MYPLKRLRKVTDCNVGYLLFRQYELNFRFVSSETCHCKSGDHFQHLTEGLSILDFGTLATSVLAVFGERAFPITTNGFGQATIAAGEHGKVFYLKSFNWEQVLRSTGCSLTIQN